MLKRAVSYTRVSTREQVEEGGSLSTQERICREYANKFNFDLVKSFVEQGESAKTANRKELKNLLSFCTDKKNKIDAVIIYKLDRMSRYTSDYLKIKEILKECGIEIVSASEAFEDNPIGRFMETVLAGSAQLDNDVRTERCTNGMRDAVREGRYVWMAPIGYENVKVAGKATIAPSNMAPLVKEAFLLLSKGIYTIDEVKKIVTDKGLLKRDGKPVCKAYFHHLIRNPLYFGRIEKFGEVHKGLFETVVSEELFNQVQLVLKNNGKKSSEYKTDNPDFLLRRFITHPSGLKLTGSWSKGRSGKKYAFYRFGMKGANYQKEQLESDFMKFMDAYSMNKKHLDKLKKFVEVKFNKATTDSRKKVILVEKRLQELDQQQTSLVQKNLKGIINDDVLMQQLEIIGKEKMQSQALLLSLKEKTIDVSKLLDICEEFMTRPSHVWEKMPPAIKLKLQRFQFPLGVTFDGERFGTTTISLIFNAKPILSPIQSEVVDPIGFEPMTSSLQMRRSTN